MSIERLRRAADQIRKDAYDAASISGHIVQVDVDPYPLAVAKSLDETAETWTVLTRPGVIGNPNADPLLAALVAVANAYLGDNA